MEHIAQQPQAVDAHVVCEELAAARRETNHFWDVSAIDTTHPPVTAVHLGEAPSVAAPLKPPVPDLDTLAVGDTIHVTPTPGDPVGVLRQTLCDLKTTDDTTSRTLRDIIAPTRRIAADV